jgi:regulatory protein
VPTLTALAPDPRQPAYRVVAVDRGRLASLPGDAVDALDLRLGAELSGPVLERLQELAEVEAALEAAVHALAAHARSRAELGRRLRWRHAGPAVDQALARLERSGLLDDRRFAHEYARARAARGRGASRILTELLTRGVERSVAEGAVATLVDSGEATRALRNAATRRVAQLAQVPPRERRRRLLGYLGRRGFRGAEVLALVQELCP